MSLAVIIMYDRCVAYVTVNVCLHGNNELLKNSSGLSTP